MFQRQTLNSGLRVISSNIPHTKSICIIAIIGAGSRYEEPDQSGISHFLEHLCFKGTQLRATGKEISEAIEGVGGILIGATDKELTMYWCKVALSHFDTALDVVSDMLCNSRLDSHDIEIERQVIVEEISMNWDTPQCRVDTLIDELLWPDQSLGKDTAGTKSTVGALTQQDIASYFARQYSPNNTVISVAGNISHDEVVASVQKAFKKWQKVKPLPWFPALDNQQSPRCKAEHRDTEQVHLCLGMQGLSVFHPDRFALDLLSVTLGEGMSSRLFTEIREKRGLAYSVSSHTEHFLDSGSFTIFAGVHPNHVQTTVAAIFEELHCVKDGISEVELRRAKELCKGRLILRMEDTHSVSAWLGVQQMLTGKIITVDEVIALIDSVQIDDVRRIAQDILITPKLNLAVVGPVPNEDKLEDMLRL